MFQFSRIFFLKYIFIFFFTVFLIPSFGVFSNTKSNDIVFSILSMIYPKNEHVSTVILTNDNDISPSVFPPKMDIHAKFLDDISIYEPKALVIDILFLDKRLGDNLSNFSKALKLFKRKKIPVFIVESYSSEKDIRGDLKELNSLENVYIPVSPILGNFVNGTFAYRYFDERGEKTVAAAVAEHFNWIDLDSYQEQDEFQIWWSGIPTRHLPEKKISDYVENYSTSMRLLGIVDIPVLSNEYFYNFLKLLSISGETLRLINDYRFLKTPPQIELQSSFISRHGDKKLVTDFIKDKIIFYGTNFSYSSDLLRNPVFSRDGKINEIDGIFFHSMALQNMHDGENNFSTNLGILLNILYYSISCILSLIISLVVFKLNRFFQNKYFLFLVLFLATFLISTVNLCLSGIAIICFDVAPANWIALSSISWLTVVSMNTSIKS